MDPVEERRRKSLDKSREQGLMLFRMEGYQSWTHEDFTVFIAGYLIGVYPNSPPHNLNMSDPEHAFVFGLGFHDAWQDWQRVLEQRKRRGDE